VIEAETEQEVSL